MDQTPCALRCDGRRCGAEQLVGVLEGDLKGISELGLGPCRDRVDFGWHRGIAGYVVHLGWRLPYASCHRYRSGSHR
jgi:hypothetical protein